MKRMLAARLVQSLDDRGQGTKDLVHSAFC